MTPPASVDFDSCAKCNALLQATADALNQKGVLQQQLKGVLATNWIMFNQPGVLGCAIDGTTGRFTFTVTGPTDVLDVLESSLKQAGFASYKDSATNADRRQFFSPLLQPLDALTQECWKLEVLQKISEPIKCLDVPSSVRELPTKELLDESTRKQFLADAYTAAKTLDAYKVVETNHPGLETNGWNFFSCPGVEGCALDGTSGFIWTEVLGTKDALLRLTKDYDQMPMLFEDANVARYRSKLFSAYEYPTLPVILNFLEKTVSAPLRTGVA